MHLSTQTASARSLASRSDRVVEPVTSTPSVDSEDEEALEDVSRTTSCLMVTPESAARFVLLNRSRTPLT